MHIFSTYIIVALHLVVPTFVYSVPCGICYDFETKEAIENIISSWYLGQIEVALNGADADQFNSLIPLVFDCDGYLDICIDRKDIPGSCAVGNFTNCDQLTDEENGFFTRLLSATTNGITFGHMAFECGEVDEIVVTISKTFFTENGNNLSLDKFQLKRIQDNDCERDNWRITAWDVTGKLIDNNDHLSSSNDDISSPNI
eukprot:386655_1